MIIQYCRTQEYAFRWYLGQCLGDDDDDDDDDDDNKLLLRYSILHLRST